MEIVTIPLKGILAHKDSLGSEGTITAGEVQIMSAGSGIRHSEFNGSASEAVNLLQIWVFPKERNIEPRYDQKRFDTELAQNRFQILVSPSEDEGALWINQNAVFAKGFFKSGGTYNYQIKHPGNGAYVFVIEGSIKLDQQLLARRDAVGVYDAERFDFEVKEDARVLVIEVPME
jgi:redox-sensitive bicupin YhaK (pirin superfamily)